jgi:hypothetical protein
MGIARGPNLIKDNLVFGYDTNYGVADNNTTTRYYKGKPTENLLALAGADTDLERSGAAPSYSYHSVNITSYIQSRWSSGNNVLAQSFEGKRDYVVGGTGGGNDGYPRMYVYFSDWSWSSSFGISSYDWSYGKQILTMPNPTGKTVYMTIYHMNSQNPGKSYSRKHSVSFNAIDTPYIKGSRSSTESLIDLKRTVDIDVSNVSFDSTGQPDFDGTDDIITQSRIIDTANYSAEFVFKADVNTTGTEHWLGSQYPGTGRVIFDLYTDNTLRNFCSGTSITGSTVIVTGNWYHVVFTRNSSGVAHIYLNGAQDATGTISSSTPVNAPFHIAGTTVLSSKGFNGNIAVVKLYNTDLTATEAAQNYKAYKNRFNI